MTTITSSFADNVILLTKWKWTDTCHVQPWSEIICLMDKSDLSVSRISHVANITYHTSSMFHIFPNFNFWMSYHIASHIRSAIISCVKGSINFLIFVFKWHATCDVSPCCESSIWCAYFFKCIRNIVICLIPRWHVARHLKTNVKKYMKAFIQSGVVLYADHTCHDATSVWRVLYNSSWMLFGSSISAVF